MGRMGSTTSVRARQMRRGLAGWQRSGLTLREFGEKRGIPLSTLSWWRRVFRHAGDEERGIGPPIAEVFPSPIHAKFPTRENPAKHCGRRPSAPKS